MEHKISGFAVSMILIVGCLAQTPGADKHVRQLIEHWRWKQYWYGTTELGSLYAKGREFRALVFWRADDMPPSVGFCSADLGVCQFYPNTSAVAASFEMKVSPGDDPRAAFRRFLSDSLGQGGSPLPRLSEPKGADYSTEILKVALPPLDPPAAIHNRTTRPRVETDQLVASLSCLPEQTGCKAHILVPFYSASDPWVPVFRECSGCTNPRPMIIFMRFVEGNWWHGARDFDDGAAFVSRTREQIGKALMVEAGQ
jgi:hypothetical protein